MLFQASSSRELDPYKAGGGNVDPLHMIASVISSVCMAIKLLMQPWGRKNTGAWMVKCMAAVSNNFTMFRSVFYT